MKGSDPETHEPADRMQGRLPLCYLEALLRPARSRGHDTDGLLMRCGLLPLPLADASHPVSLLQFGRTMRALQRMLRDEMLALNSRALPPGTLALVVRQMLQCQTLGDALRLGCSLYRLAMDDFAIRLRLDDDDAVLHVVDTRPGHEHRTTAHLVLTYGAIGLMSWMVQRHIPLRAVVLPGVLPGCANAPPLFDEPASLGGPGQIRFDARWLNARVVVDMRTFSSFALYWPARRLPPHRGVRAMVVRVRRCLRQWEIGGLPTLPELADSMGLSAKLLHRRLQDEGQSYRAIVDKMRCEEAIRLLGDPHLTVTEIGYRLGFSEPSAFHRAFKRGTGQTPMAYRHLLAKVTGR